MAEAVLVVSGIRVRWRRNGDGSLKGFDGRSAGKVYDLFPEGW